MNDEITFEPFEHEAVPELEPEWEETEPDTYLDEELAKKAEEAHLKHLDSHYRL